MAAFAVLLVSAMTVAFTNASGARSIAVNSELLQWSNATSGTAAITRAALSQAVVFAIDEELGVASRESAAAAVGEAERSVAGLASLAAERPEGLDEIAPDVMALVEAAENVVAELQSGDTTTAISALDSGFEPRYTTVARRLAGAQAFYAAEIDDAETTAARIDNSMRWLAMLLIPGIAILLYRVILRRRFERRKVEFDERLRAERKLSLAKDDFIAGISHELRTPLTSILGFSQHLIDRDLADTDETREMLEMINRESEELARMVEDLLTAARLESEVLAYDFGPVDLAEQARSITTRLSHPDIRVREIGEPDAVWADEARVRQIIRNLISNALQHGGVDVRVRVRSGEGISACDVVDDGPGVPAAITDRLFERFVHEGPQSLLTGSVGLGLAIARSLANAMGGDVSYSRVDGLTIFTLTLPVVDDTHHGTSIARNGSGASAETDTAATQVMPRDATDVTGARAP